jgi:hypothetical protein
MALVLQKPCLAILSRHLPEQGFQCLKESPAAKGNGKAVVELL